MLTNLCIIGFSTFGLGWLLLAVAFGGQREAEFIGGPLDGETIPLNTRPRNGERWAVPFGQRSVAEYEWMEWQGRFEFRGFHLPVIAGARR